MHLGCPDLDALIRYRDGRDVPGGRKKFARHIAHCARCLAEFERLRQACAEPQKTASADMLQEVLAALAEWQDSESPSAALGQLAAQVRPYLGDRATQQLVHPGPGGGAELVGELEPVLAQFLGKRAAARLVTQVLDRVLARG